MKSRVVVRCAGLVLAAAIALATQGCGKKAGLHSFIPNQRPTVILTSGPINTRDTVSFSITLRWSADDPDGRIDHYEYAVDPKDNDTLWIRTTDNRLEERFASRDPLPVGALGTNRRSVQSHTFVLKAFDNLGLASVPKTRSFTSSTISPTVSITSPLGSDLGAVQLPPTTRIEWVGDDPDGVTSRKPIYYLWKLFKFGNPEFDYYTIKTKPDSLRRFYAKTNFAGWDTVPGPRGANTFVDLPTERSPNLELQTSYLFVVVAFDTAKAYSPAFSYAAGGNILEFSVGFAGYLGPAITAFNDFFFYTMISGGFAPGNPVTWQHLEVPSTQTVRFNWTVIGGSRIQWFRWRINGDVFDETVRTNEATDWFHWSAQSSGTTACTIGPFPPNQQAFLYIEAMDGNGLLSLLTIVLHPVLPTFDRNLLIVDDTRLETDQYRAGRVQAYTTIWPAAAELDTFLYARGGVPWRGTQVPDTAAVQPVTPPGLFAGYAFDTLGTLLGLPVASSGVPLSLLGKYRHVIWLVDKNGAENINLPGTGSSKTMSTLRWMSSKNRMNTLGTFMTAGGLVWLAGGDAALASLTPWDATGAANNNKKYGYPLPVFSSLPPANELIAGRLMHSGAHWRSEMLTQSGLTSAASLIKKSPRIPSAVWTSPGWNYTRPITGPNYQHLLPNVMRVKNATDDLLPPTRTSGVKYYDVQFEAEYLSQPNEISEDMDPDPFTLQMQPTLDTLMSVFTPRGLTQSPSGYEAATMTYYHGVESPEFVFTGFNFWMWTHRDCQDLVDFVLQEIWKMPPPSRAARSISSVAVRPGAQMPAGAPPAPATPGAWSRLPNPRTGGR